jgi:hypothetical protein
VGEKLGRHWVGDFVVGQKTTHANLPNNCAHPLHLRTLLCGEIRTIRIARLGGEP